MACSNYCSTEDLGQVTYHLGYVSRSEQLGKHLRDQEIEREGERQREDAHIEMPRQLTASQSQVVRSAVAEVVRDGGPSIVSGLLAAGVVFHVASETFGPLFEAITLSIAERRR